jgi:hypothetical protein
MKSDALLLYLTIAVIVLLLILFVVSYSNNFEGFGNFYDTQNRFTKQQGKYFNEKINRSIPTNLGLQQDMKKIQNTLFSVDTMLNKNIIPDNPPFNPEEDPLPGFRDRNRKECETVSRPKYFKPRDPQQPVACGWWYIDDDNKESLANLGTYNGPVDPGFARANPGGEWIWDTEKAQKLEDAKACRKIKSCDIADIKPECGFCLDSNTGVPVSNGEAKYANDPQLSCSKVITDPAMCPPPESVEVSKTVIADDGSLLKSGDVYKGEVIPFDIETTKGVCTPNPYTGQLTVECLLNLVTAIGYSEQGVIVKILKGDSDGFYTRVGKNYDMYQITKNILKTKEKFELRGQLVGDGSISKAEALADYNRIFTMMKSKPAGLVKSACLWLVYGKEYDPCMYDENERGPFDDRCLQRVALEAGCQRSGYKFPGAATYGTYNDMTWSMVNQFFANLFNKTADKGDSAGQRQATLDCLGITIAADAAILCGKKGGKCVVLSDAEIQRNPAVMGVQAQIDAYLTQVKTSETPIDKAIAEEMVGEARQQKAKILAMIKRVNFCPPDPPFARWDFSLGRHDELLGVYKKAVKQTGSIIYEVTAGKKAAVFKGKSTGIKVSGNFKTEDIKSIAAMVCMNQDGTGHNPRIWELTNSDPGFWCGDNIDGQGLGDNKGFGMTSYQGCQGPNLRTMNNVGEMKTGVWYHVVWAMDRDYTGMTIFVNGVKAARWSDPNNAVFRGRAFKTFQIANSVEQPHKDFSLCWLHLFDYTMDERACKMDMEKSWTFPPPPPPPLEPKLKSVYKGCFRDTGDRALPIRVNNVSKTEDCMAQALNIPGATEYGLQYYGECWIGKNHKYDRYGPMNEPECGTLGTGWNNRVYSIETETCNPAFPTNIQILPGKMIGKIRHNGDYTLSFTIRVSEVVGNWGSIVHFTNTGNNCCGNGERAPGIWFYPGTTKLYIILGDSLFGGDWGLRDHEFIVPLNRDCKFKLECEGKNITCSLDNDEYTTKQPGTRASGEFLVFSGDPWHPPAVGTLSNFCFTTIPELVAPPPPKFIGPAMCMDLGRSSGDRRTRIYEKAECDKLDGNWYPNGECVKKQGGSFSWECRTLNNNDALNTYKGPPKCKDLGKPSDDDNLRLYTKNECDDLGGNFSGNGECTKKEGGSFSYECRELNKISGLGRAFLGPPVCMDLGSPSSDGNIRIYSKSECDKLNGNSYANGECTKKEGGSFSWDCRSLNNIAELTKFKGPPQCKDLGRPSPNGQIRLYEKTECDRLGGNWYGNGECLKKEGGSWSGECGVLNSIR